MPGRARWPVGGREAGGVFGAAIIVAAGLAAWIPAARAQTPARGSGTGYATATETGPTTSAGPPVEERYESAEDLPVMPRHGFMGAPGAAEDSSGSSRLGKHGEYAYRPEYGESPPEWPASPPSIRAAYDTWRSGDLIRSASSADVRTARQQQAPDLEWATAAVPGGNPRNEPQEPYGVKFQQEQEKPYR